MLRKRSNRNFPADQHVLTHVHLFHGVTFDSTYISLNLQSYAVCRCSTAGTRSMTLVRRTLLLLLLVGITQSAIAQNWDDSKRLSSWIPLQALPNLTWYASDAASAFGLEWEATPLSYSFGINKHVSPWSSFIVIPTYRFTGSVELNVAGQLYTSPIASSHGGISTTLMGYVPLVERGEHLTLNLGVTMHRVAGKTTVLKVAGFSTLFGFVHFNLKQSSHPTIWITSFEFRFF